MPNDFYRGVKKFHCSHNAKEKRGTPKSVPFDERAALWLDVLAMTTKKFRIVQEVDTTEP